MTLFLGRPNTFSSFGGRRRTSRFEYDKTWRFQNGHLQADQSKICKRILNKAKLLKTVGDDLKEWKNVYLAPDRNREERLKHKSLVTDMKQLIISEPSKHHFIRGGAIISVKRN